MNTAALFDLKHDDSATSPIDQFIENTLRLNKMWVGNTATTSLEQELGILLILGYVSAVESFMRALIRRVLTVDPYSQSQCETYTLSYAAANHHRSEMLPEALLEEQMFSGKKGIRDGLRKFLDLELKENVIVELLEQYGQVCELRHCCVHRFGKLGTKNAVELGLDRHKNFLEKPIRLTTSDMESIADLLFVLVKSINNEVFRFLLDRSVKRPMKGETSLGLGWTWNKARDRKRYRAYYSIFASERDASPSPSADELYERFRTSFRQVGRRKAKKLNGGRA
ncbi:hypothetical protein [Lysobacter firmicutimachus]|uniref:RiboL-PSP-HEPN domain-containing protein n=1 Tax=Lysobacter firmicutimachus TaxID=1792846 RepID=A0ABU8CWL3_9GAMM